MKKIGFYFALITTLLFGGQALADEIQVAVAANFTAPMKEIGAAFEAKTGHKVSLSFGATGNFYTQIKNGAPFDILLAADSETIKKMGAEGLTAPGSDFCYTQGQLVLWSTKADYIDAEGKVLNSDFKHLAIADPKLAPYGLAAQEVLTKLGLWDKLEQSKRLVEGKNISQAFQFVDSGNAELGLVALSQIFKEGEPIKGSYWKVPADLYSPIKQDGAILKKAENSQAAKDLMAFLKGEEARKIIKSYGYIVD